MHFTKRKLSVILFLFLFVLTSFLQMGVQRNAKAAQNDISLQLEATNEWSDGTANYMQINATINNATNQSISGWKVTVPIASSALINQSWSCTCSIADQVLTIVADSNNQDIQGKSTLVFGFILKNPGDFQTSEAVFTYSGDEELPTPLISITPTPETTITPTPETTITPPVVTIIPPTPLISITPTPETTITPTPTTPVPETGKKDWLYTDGSRIFDEDGKEVWLTGINWFGYNTGTNVFDGVWACDLDKTIKEIANRGFNLMRIPISSELLLDWKAGVYPKPCVNDFVNPYLAGMNSLEIFDHVVSECKKNGIKIMMDIHCATNAVAHYYPVWFTPDLTEAQYIESLRWMTDRYKDDDTIVAIDLKNEPHGKANEEIRAIWNDSTDPCNWKYIATKAANAVLDVNPNLLIVVEGIEIYPMDLENNSDFHSTNAKEYYGTWWGGNLRGVKDYPIDLGAHQNKLVYSPHDYGPAVYQQTWFEGDYTMESLYNDCWHDNWFYIQEENIAPLLIGEWGGYMTEPNLTWMTYLRDFIIEHRINHTFWCFNANSGDTGGLVLYDFTTWDEEKYNFLKPALWQKDGKFVGLDHDIPLGDSGLSLSQY